MDDVVEALFDERRRERRDSEKENGHGNTGPAHKNSRVGRERENICSFHLSQSSRAEIATIFYTLVPSSLMRSVRKGAVGIVFSSRRHRLFRLLASTHRQASRESQMKTITATQAPSTRM